MKAVILAGGLGTRLSEETAARPKPMVHIGGRPVLWHIMKLYSAFGIEDFVICCGYKGNVIKEFFSTYSLYASNVTFDFRSNTMQVHQSSADKWRVTLVDTGEDTQTGGRIRRVRDFLDPSEPFCLTYGDAVADINISELIAFHRAHGRLATVTAVQPAGRFGFLHTDASGSQVKSFEEKPPGDGGWVNGGFFILSPKAINYIEDDTEVWERGPMLRLVRDRELQAYQLNSFWQCMDTQRDRVFLEQMWQEKAPWKKW
jgi:glucose-1-phosphate cytidylyltransferase